MLSITCNVTQGEPRGGGIEEENTHLKEKVSQLEGKVSQLEYEAWKKASDLVYLDKAADIASSFRITPSMETMSPAELEQLLKGDNVVDKHHARLRENVKGSEVLIYDTCGDTRGVIRLPVSAAYVDGKTDVAFRCKGDVVVAPSAVKDRWMSKCFNHTVYVKRERFAPFPVDYSVILPRPRKGLLDEDGEEGTLGHLFSAQRS